MSTWVLLKTVLDEFLRNVHAIAKCLGPILDRNLQKDKNVNQKFCVAITANIAYNLLIAIKNPIKRNMIKIQVDYNNFFISCHYCLATTHLIREYRVYSSVGALEVETKVHVNSQYPSKAQSPSKNVSAADFHKGIQAEGKTICTPSLALSH